MNHRIQLFPISSSPDFQTRLSRYEDPSVPTSDWENAKAFRSWSVYDFDFEPACYSGRGSLLGLAIAMGVGAGFWTAAGLLIAHLW
jgi:hypothetical protein